jgi:hypothetical protein
VQPNREAPGGEVPFGGLGPRQGGSLIMGGEEDGMAKRKAAFGGYSINFKGCKDSVEAVFGSKPIGPSEMTKKLWVYVKRKRLARR